MATKCCSKYCQNLYDYCRNCGNIAAFRAWYFWQQIYIAAILPHICVLEIYRNGQQRRQDHLSNQGCHFHLKYSTFIILLKLDKSMMMQCFPFFLVTRKILLQKLGVCFSTETISKPSSQATLVPLLLKFLIFLNLVMEKGWALEIMEGPLKMGSRKLALELTEPTALLFWTKLPEKNRNVALT